MRTALMTIAAIALTTIAVADNPTPREGYDCNTISCNNSSHEGEDTNGDLLCWTVKNCSRGHFTRCLPAQATINGPCMENSHQPPIKVCGDCQGWSCPPRTDGTCSGTCDTSGDPDDDAYKPDAKTSCNIQIANPG